MRCHFHVSLVLFLVALGLSGCATSPDVRTVAQRCATGEIGCSPTMVPWWRAYRDGAPANPAPSNVRRVQDGPRRGSRATGSL